jgi:hypothetical protein
MSKIIANKKTHSSNEAIICLAKTILKNLERRLPLNGMVQIATLLDPSTRPLLPLMQESSGDESDDRENCINQRLQKFKKLLIDFCCENVKASNPSAYANTVQGSVSNCDTSCSSTITTTTVCSSSVLSGAMSIKLQVLQEIQGVYASMNNIQQAVTSEVEPYFNLQPAYGEENPLIFWRKHKNSFPLLSQVARKVLTVSCSSVPVESMFSSMGLLINAKRASLEEDTANMLSVIHDNYGKYYPV